MACPNVFDLFRVATEDLPNDVYRIASYRSVWMNLIRRSIYPHGVGLTRSVFTIPNTEPTTDEETWSAITLANGSNTGACGNNFNQVDVGFIEDTYSPEQFQLKGPILCRKDLIFSHNADGFLDNYVNVLGKRAKRSWEKRYEKLYIDNALKVVANTDLPVTEQAGVDSLDESTCDLTMEMLNNIAITLMEDGATNPDSSGFIELGPDGPIFSIYMGIEAIDNIYTNNSDLRQDVRHTPQATDLIARLGGTRVLRNWRFIPNLHPPRYNYSGGDYVRVNTFINDASATKGNPTEINPAYRTATHEAALVLSDRVFTSEIVPPLNSTPAGDFPATEYMGEWKWVTGGNNLQGVTCEDPLHNFGQHFSEFIHAPRPDVGKFKYAYWIVYKRCIPASFDCVTCSS